MNRTICIGLMALPVYLYNAQLGNTYSSDVSIVENQLPVITALVVYSTNSQLDKFPWQISARDDQTEDCLRAGTCRD
ncbi:hypothetical protein [Nostoc commune]|uniref:hypothetical protein n=1 Tax=Nostoc commune TaxID=1178 RepID=UPI0018C4D4E3|nr:hypothetical protein [Nostoc commune]MBG1260148.1 hypothetical protein [Nostoc commune BAE]